MKIQDTKIKNGRVVGTTAYINNGRFQFNDMPEPIISEMDIKFPYSQKNITINKYELSDGEWYSDNNNNNSHTKTVINYHIIGPLSRNIAIWSVQLLGRYIRFNISNHINAPDSDSFSDRKGMLTSGDSEGNMKEDKGYNWKYKLKRILGK